MLRSAFSAMLTEGVPHVHTKYSILFNEFAREDLHMDTSTATYPVYADERLKARINSRYECG